MVGLGGAGQGKPHSSLRLAQRSQLRQTSLGLRILNSLLCFECRSPCEREGNQRMGICC